MQLFFIRYHWLAYLSIKLGTVICVCQLSTKIFSITMFQTGQTSQVIFDQYKIEMTRLCGELWFLSCRISFLPNFGKQLYQGGLISLYLTSPLWKRFFLLGGIAFSPSLVNTYLLTRLNLKPILTNKEGEFKNDYFCRGTLSLILTLLLKTSMSLENYVTSRAPASLSTEKRLKGPI